MFSPEPDCLFTLVADLWGNCMKVARAAGEVPAESVQTLIAQSRDLLTKQGCTREDTNRVFALLSSWMFWEWHEPTDAVFKTLLDFELTEFWKERGICETHFS